MRNLYSDTLLRSFLHFDGIPFFYIQKFRRLFTDNYSITGECIRFFRLPVMKIHVLFCNLWIP